MIMITSRTKQDKPRSGLWRGWADELLPCVQLKIAAGLREEHTKAATTSQAAAIMVLTGRI